MVEALPGKLCMLFDGAEFAFGITFEFSGSKTCYFRLMWSRRHIKSCDGAVITTSLQSILYHTCSTSYSIISLYLSYTVIAIHTLSFRLNIIFNHITLTIIYSHTDIIQSYSFGIIYRLASYWLIIDSCMPQRVYDRYMISYQVAVIRQSYIIISK